MRGIGRLWLGLCLVSCAPAGPASLRLTATPRSIRPNGAKTRVQVAATLASGLIGQGRVTARASPGAPAEDVELTLDSFGTATFEASCDVASDPDCIVGSRFTVSAKWMVDGKVVTGEATVSLDPLPPGAEVICDDGVDQDEDGMTDCADADCDAQTCSDKEPCTTGERCSGSTCAGGSPTTCNTPPNTFCAMGTGTCMQGIGCVYPPQNVGLSCTDGNPCTTGDRCTNMGTCSGSAISCQNTTNPCAFSSGTCNPMTGQCQFSNRPNGASCGIDAAMRCCNGSCVDISLNPSHCGGCGFVCASSQCIDAAVSGCQPPLDVSGRCACTVESDCPPSTDCVSGRCEPNSCKSMQNLQNGSGTCLNYCAY